MTSDQGDSSRSRNGRGRYVRSPETAERDAEAARLRVQGRTYQQIADRLGLSHRDLARRAVDRALTATVQEPAEELRSLELLRLDELWRTAWRVLTTEHVRVSAGRVVEHQGKPLRDNGPALAAIDRLVRISERRCRLLGLDAPLSVTVLTLDQIDAEIRRLMEELGREGGHGERG